MSSFYPAVLWVLLFNNNNNVALRNKNNINNVCKQRKLFLYKKTS